MKNNQKCPICDKVMIVGGNNEKTKHHLFFPKKNYPESENVKLTICKSCHESFNDYVKRFSRLTKKDCVELFVRFCRCRGKNAYAIYKQLKK